MATPTLPLRVTVVGTLSVFALTGWPGFAAEAPPPPAMAPVPPVVAVQRMSPAEAAQLDAALKKVALQQDPAVREVFAQHPELALVPPPRNTAIVPALNPGFMPRHESFVEIAKAGNIDVLFMGDSITDFWRRAGAPGVVNPPIAGKAVFDKYYGTWKTANFGIAGDTTQGVLWRLQNGEGQGFQPKVIMLMIGTNNTGTNSAAEIAEGIGAVVLEMRKDFPQAKILLLAVFPRSGPTAPVRATLADINALITRLDDRKNVFYLDIGPRFLDADGAIPADVMADGLHPTEKGYEIWAEAVKVPLDNLLKSGTTPGPATLGPAPPATPAQ